MVEGNVRLEGYDPLWILTSTTFYYYIRNESAFGSTSFVLFTRTLSFFFGGGCNINRIIHDGARAERIDSFFGGKNLGLVSINKLRQLCKSIFDIEI